MTIKTDSNDTPHLPAETEPEIVVSPEGQEDTERREFPLVFYDIDGVTLMSDPVVDPSGDSRERSSVTDNSVTYYPNRALKAVIERETELADSGSIRGYVRRANESMRNIMGTLMEKSVFAIEHRPLPKSFYCVITTELISDPVITPDGHTYEREAIEAWISRNGDSPITREQLAISDLRPNNALYELIQAEKGRTLESMHPSIRRWKESGTITSRRTLPQDVEEPQEGQSFGSSVSPSAPLEQENPVATSVQAMPPVTTYSYPTSHEEFQRRQRNKLRCRVITTAAIIITVGLLLFIAGGFPAYFIVVVLMILCCGFAQLVTRNRAQRGR